MTKKMETLIGIIVAIAILGYTTASLSGNTPGTRSYLIEHQCDIDNSNIPKIHSSCCYNFRLPDGNWIENPNRICQDTFGGEET